MVRRINEILFKVRLRFTKQFKLANLYAKKYGIKMGQNVRITGRIFWGSEPYLIEIGNNVNLTQDIRFYNHGAMHPLREELPNINYFGRIKIGNNVFIGASSIILPDVTIGDNTIIGAGSVVSKNIPSNVVAAGIPAKVISTLEDYKKRRLEKAVYITEKDPKKRKLEIIRKLEAKEKELKKTYEDMLC